MPYCPDDPYISYKSKLIDRYFKFVFVQALLLFQASLTVDIQTINPFIYKNAKREEKDSTVTSVSLPRLYLPLYDAIHMRKLNAYKYRSNNNR